MNIFLTMQTWDATTSQNGFKKSFIFNQCIFFEPGRMESNGRGGEINFLKAIIRCREWQDLARYVAITHLVLFQTCREKHRQNHPNSNWGQPFHSIDPKSTPLLTENNNIENRHFNAIIYYSINIEFGGKNPPIE